MNDRDWQFAIGELGDPLADVEVGKNWKGLEEYKLC